MFYCMILYNDNTVDEFVTKDTDSIFFAIADIQNDDNVMQVDIKFIKEK